MAILCDATKLDRFHLPDPVYCTSPVYAPHAHAHVDSYWMWSENKIAARVCARALFQSLNTLYTVRGLNSLETGHASGQQAAVAVWGQLLSSSLLSSLFSSLCGDGGRNENCKQKQKQKLKALGVSGRLKTFEVAC